MGGKEKDELLQTLELRLSRQVLKCRHRSAYASCMHGSIEGMLYMHAGVHAQSYGTVVGRSIRPVYDDDS